MEPSRTFQEEGERVLHDHMAQFQESLSPEEKERIQEETLAMKRFRRRPTLPKQPPPFRNS